MFPKECSIHLDSKVDVHLCDGVFEPTRLLRNPCPEVIMIEHLLVLFAHLKLGNNFIIEDTSIVHLGFIN